MRGPIIEAIVSNCDEVWWFGGLVEKRRTPISSIHIGNQGWAIGVKTCNHFGISLHVMKLRETQVGHAQS